MLAPKIHDSCEESYVQIAILFAIGSYINFVRISTRLKILFCIKK